jgi:hypothetical protein
MMATTEQLLERIAIALEARSNDEPQGFVDISSETQYVWIGKEGDANWYYRKDEVNAPINRLALIGRLTGLQLREKEYKGETTFKIFVHLDCGRAGKVCLIAGIDTMFSRSLLLRLRKISREAIANPITIIPRASKDEEKVIFADVALGGERIAAEWDKVTECRALLAECVNLFGFECASVPASASVERIDREQLNRLTSDQFHRLQRTGMSVEAIRSLAISKFPHFKTSRDLNDSEAQQLLLLLKNHLPNAPEVAEPPEL